MKNRSKRPFALLGTLAMSAALLVTGASGVASADPARAYGKYEGTFSSTNIDFERVVDPSIVTYGDTVTVTSKIIDSRGLWVGNIHKWIEDETPACMKYVDGTARWRASGGNWENPTSKPGEFAAPTATTIRAQFGARVSDPLELVAEYEVYCPAQENFATGGMAWDGTLKSNEASSRSMGPSITVQRKGVTTTLDQPESVVIGQATPLQATTDAPDGTTVQFLIDGNVVASAQAQGGFANTTWTAGAPGSYQITAQTGQTQTHSSSISNSVLSSTTFSALR